MEANMTVVTSPKYNVSWEYCSQYTCKGRCGHIPVYYDITRLDCSCVNQCLTKGDCCFDYLYYCTNETSSQNSWHNHLADPVLPDEAGDAIIDAALTASLHNAIKPNIRKCRYINQFQYFWVVLPV